MRSGERASGWGSPDVVLNLITQDLGNYNSLLVYKVFRDAPGHHKTKTIHDVCVNGVPGTIFRGFL